MSPRSFSVLPALTLTATLAFTAPAPAAEIRVDHTGGGDYLTIQEGVDAASEADTVWVAEGIYTGDLNRDVDFGDKNLVVRSELGPNLTTIDCQGLGRAFLLQDGQDATSIIRGFTILNGSSSSGGAIALYNDASPEITGCRIMYCDAPGAFGAGGALYCKTGASPQVTGVLFVGNTGRYGGAVHSSEGASPTFTDVAFIENVAGERGGAWYCEESVGRVTISSCTFIRNSVTDGHGGGLFLFDSDAAITSCTFSENAADHAGGVWCYNSDPLISGSIIAFSTTGKAIECGGTTSNPTIVHCTVYGNAGGDDLCGSPGENIFVDPRFCNMGDNNLTLCANSVCLAENNEWNESIGAHEEGCTACDSLVERTTWGAIKGLYR